jgi:RNA recognition motif-containing protein
MAPKTELKGFHPIKIKMPSSKRLKEKSVDGHITASSASLNLQKIYHTIYVKKDTSTEMPKNKTLFILNLPIDSDRHNLDLLFKDCGVIDNVKLPTNITSGSNGHLVFKDEESINYILTVNKLSWPKNSKCAKPIMDKYLQGWNRPDITLLKAKVDEAMEIFEEEQRRIRIAEQEKSKVDEDGFVIVGKSKSTRNVGENGASVLTLSKADAETLKPKDKSLKDFYRFQMRERKRAGNPIANIELKELRKKFELDKAKVEKMKEQRRFRPY